MNEHLIQYFKPKFACQINHGISGPEAHWFVEEDAYAPTLDFDVYLPKYKRNLQRDLVWSDHQKSELIKSILRDVSIPPLVVVQHRNKGENRIWQIIDGKQRLSTVLGYIRNEFPIEVEGNLFFHKDLPEVLQRKVYYFEFLVDIAYSYDYKPVTDDDKIAMYLYINYAGTPQDESYMDELAGLVNKPK